MVSDNPPIGRRNRRLTDILGRLPHWGAVTKFARKHGLGLVAVQAGIRNGLYIVGDDGEIVPSGDGLTDKRVAGLRGQRVTSRAAKHGAFKKARQQFNLSIHGLYAAIHRGEIILDPATREYVRATEKPVAKPARVAQPPLELRPTLPVDPVIGAHRADWERHVDGWLQKAVELSEYRPADWTFSRVDVLKYLRGRLNVLVELAEQDEADNPPTAEQKAERVATAIRIGKKLAVNRKGSRHD